MAVKFQQQFPSHCTELQISKEGLMGSQIGHDAVKTPEKWAKCHASWALDSAQGKIQLVVCHVQIFFTCMDFM